MAPVAGIKKLYYSIGELSAILGIEPHVLRYWESEFEQLRPRRNSAQRRTYAADDVAMVERISYLLRVEKYTIEGVKQILARDGLSDPSPKDYTQLLQLRSFLENIKDAIK